MTRSRHLLPLLLATAPAVVGCKASSDPATLFDEEGTWSVISYDIGEGLSNIVLSESRDAFVLNFAPEHKVVQTAACGAEGADTPDTSHCRTLPSSTRWTCHCFAYAFEDSQMRWREFAAGDTPPEVSFDDAADMDAGGNSGGGESGGSSEGTFTLSVGAVANRNDTYTFAPLPPGVFGSDGTVGTIIVEPRANSLFQNVLMDPEGRMGCDPCVAPTE